MTTEVSAPLIWASWAHVGGSDPKIACEFFPANTLTLLTLSSCHLQPLQFSVDDNPDEITADPILKLHRHGDGYINFVAKDGDGLCPLYSIRADHLDAMLPGIREQLEKDAFVSLNASFRETWTRRSKHRGPAHSTDTLRYLCANYADIDHYRVGRTFNDTFHDILELQDAGLIPRASVIVNSGRGMWLLWFLRDAKEPNHAHIGAWSDNPWDHVQLYVRIQRAIIERLGHLGCDPQGTDAARHVRIDGSFHSGTERYVRWWIQGDSTQAVYAYTLEELARHFGIVRETRLPVESRALASTQSNKNPNRRCGHIQANQNKLAAFLVLMSLRGGGFASGCRNHAAFVYALLLKKNGVNRSDMLCRVEAMGRNCRLPLSQAECRAAVAAVFRRKYSFLSFAIIAEWLAVTPAEAAMMSRETRKRFPHAVQFGANTEPPPQVSSRHQNLQQRRQAITKIVAEMGGVPSLRQMQALLIQRGHVGNHMTVSKDYRALGLQSSSMEMMESIANAKARQAKLDLIA